MKRNEGPKRIKRISISLVKQISFTRHPPDAQDTCLHVGYLVLDATLYVCCIVGRGQRVSLMTPNLYFFHSSISPNNNNHSHKRLKETHVDVYNILRRCNVPLKKLKCFNCIL